MNTFKRKFAPLLIALVSLLSSCDIGEELINSNEGNFDALWKIIDEHYCFFEYKEIDWNEVYTRYRPRVKESMSNEALFNLMGEMLAELKDGHTNLYASFDVARYWKWFEDYPPNFDENIVQGYLGTDFQIIAGLRYKILNDNIGYVYYRSFASLVGIYSFEQILSRFQACDGIIIDIRDNGGGDLTNVDRIASYFTNQRILTGYLQHKTGKGHSDFSEPYPKYLDPAPGLRWQKKVVVLTNRSSYSSANDFAAVMKILPNVKLFGDRTGGGSGLPFSSELPNGWSVRFSASPMLDREMKQIEFGIDPYKKVDMTPQDAAKGIDTIIEAAREYLRNNKG